MTLLVEDGSIVAGAESYCSVVDCASFAGKFGLAFDTTQQAACEAALRRSTGYIDAQYRNRFPGFRTARRAQSLEWPRAEAFYVTPDNGTQTPYFIDPRAFYPYDLIPQNTVPPEIVKATCLGAVKELAELGSLQPDLDRGGMISSLKAGSVDIRYAPSASPNTVFQDIENALSGLLAPRSKYTARAVR